MLASKCFHDRVFLQSATSYCEIYHIAYKRFATKAFSISIYKHTSPFIILFSPLMSRSSHGKELDGSMFTLRVTVLKEKMKRFHK